MCRARTLSTWSYMLWPAQTYTVSVPERVSRPGTLHGEAVVIVRS